MCGIAGIVSLDGAPASSAVIRKMTRLLAHRGPDGEGVYTDGPVALGHRRLAIIDLSPLARQPMMSSDERMVITYNGEVYNFPQLRVQLEAAGYSFRSSTDTEVVLAALCLWGVEAIERFNGMFALGVWDREHKRVILARDRYGIKPLYYWHNGSLVLFASEIKAFMAHPCFSPALDEAALAEYFTFQNIFTDRTLFKGVRLLPPGSILELKIGNQQLPSPKKYWDFNFTEGDSPPSMAETAEELLRLFDQAVERQLVSDVEIGAYLSGGIDSCSITAVAARHFKELKTFCIGYDRFSLSGLELSYDERPKAELISYLYKTEHYEMVLKSGDMERCLPRLVWHLEDPRIGQSYPNFYASKLAGSFVKVVLAGAGGDELFGGYPWRYYRVMRSLSFEEFVELYYEYWQRLLDPEEFKAVFSPIWPKVKDVDTREIFRSVFVNPPSRIMSPQECVNLTLGFEAKTFLHGLLVVEDKLSMAHSLETRLPFLDNDLVEFAQRVPANYKLRDIEKIVRTNENEPAKRWRFVERTNDGKLVLRQALRRYAPEEIVSQPKQGFSAPDASWFKGESIEYVKRLVLNPHARIYEWFDFDSVQSLVQQHIEGKVNRRLFIWSLINLELWLRIFLDGQLPA